MKKKALLSLVMAGTLTIGAAAAGTYAWFTGYAKSTVNSITAGTINLDVNGSSSTNGAFNIPLRTDGLVQPGDILTTGDVDGFSTITVKNNGSLPLASFGRFTIDGDTGLADDIKIIDYKVEFLDAEGQPTGRIDSFITNGVPSNNQFASNLKAWVDGDGALDIPGASWDMEALRPQESYKLTFRLEYDTAAKDQGKTCKVGFEVKATQVNSNALANLELDGVENGALAGWYTYLNNQVQ
jgi:predicted ribosomally synthesized peptide with SipW-like signal peptide